MATVKKSNIRKKGYSQATQGPGIAALSDGMIEAYKNGLLTQNQIAEQLGVKKTTVEKALKARGIKRFRAKSNTASRSSSSPQQKDLPEDKAPSTDDNQSQDFDLEDWIARAKESENVEALQAELNDAFLNILREDIDQLKATSDTLTEYIKTGHQMWRSLQGMTAMAMKGMANGQPPFNADGSMNYTTVEKLGKLARLIDLMHPNPVQHYATVVLPQQEALQGNDENELPILRIEAMTLNDIEDVQRLHCIDV